jgi:hypothetical protein
MATRLESVSVFLAPVKYFVNASRFSDPREPLQHRTGTVSARRIHDQHSTRQSRNRRERGEPVPDKLSALRRFRRTFRIQPQASWLTLKESRASFLIEKEADQADRIQRFAQVIAQHCGHIKDPLSNDSLHSLQAGIPGHYAIGLGLRRSPVFVGQAMMREDIVHYIAPHFADLASMLIELNEFEVDFCRTQKRRWNGLGRFLDQGFG